MNPIKTTAHFVGGPWDGRTVELTGTPPHYNVPEPLMPQVSYTANVPLPTDIDFRKVVYEAREVWTWEGQRHARYVTESA